ncbi:MAG: T-complex protein 1 subunit beta [Chaenotheca gracillima]|nr:MAG: T-complex protein 1 subunit beta [Chaenotheca gracillima]
MSAYEENSREDEDEDKDKASSKKRISLLGQFAAKRNGMQGDKYIRKSGASSPLHLRVRITGTQLPVLTDSTSNLVQMQDLPLLRGGQLVSPKTGDKPAKGQPKPSRLRIIVDDFFSDAEKPPTAATKGRFGRLAAVLSARMTLEATPTSPSRTGCQVTG